MLKNKNKYYATIIMAAFLGSRIQASTFDCLSENQQLARTCTTLAIDGGGVRGTIAAIVLSDLEKKLSEPLVSYFDVTAGTSTGALIILSLNLAKNLDEEVLRPLYSVAKIAQCYEEFAPRIFCSETARPYSSLGGWCGPYYSASGLESVAEEFFGYRKLNSTMTNVIIPGIEIERDKPIYFSSLNASIHPKNNFLMKDVAVAAGAAPTYFAPKRLFDLEGTGYSVIDGGVMANNPGLVAYAHAEAIYGYQPHDNLLISLGTGHSRKSLKPAEMANKGKLGWASKLISLMLRNQSHYVDGMLKQILSNKGTPNSKPKKYYRLQGTIDTEYESLDDASPANMHGLKLAGERFVEEFQEDLEEIAHRLEEIQEARYVVED